ncbi:MAG: molybdopterin molybdenumtransferase MoeA [Planctomycetota bacterium]|nr:MAG: molybdopterin molybdenumtransferase MoeA [Planctomycetota bacterium]
MTGPIEAGFFTRIRESRVTGSARVVTGRGDAAEAADVIAARSCRGRAMRDVCSALREVLQATPVGPVETVALQRAAGRVLREAISAPADAPPFSKALMDGFAVRSADVQCLPARLTVVDEIPAGAVPQRSLEPGTCAKIMTGAPLPEGADAVVRVEDTAADEPSEADERGGSGFQVPIGGSVVVLASARSVAPGANVMARGAIMRCGDRVLEAGRRLRTQEIALLGESGIATVPVTRRPRVAIVSTGDELVPVDAACGPGQIRNSNEAMLAAQVAEVGAVPTPLGIVRDDRRALSDRIAAALECDFVLLSGGVSAGERDFVPAVLRELGVRCVFHKVRLKPGKPLWFGVRGAPSGGRPDRENLATESHCAAPKGGGSSGEPVTRRGGSEGGQWHAPACVVFGLPGNPVSSMVCCELFVKPALRRWLGLEVVGPPSLQATLARPVRTRGERPTYHPARLRWADVLRRWEVAPVRWLGSADLVAATHANSLLVLPAGDRELAAGTVVEVVPLDVEEWLDAVPRHCAAPADARRVTEPRERRE